MKDAMLAAVEAAAEKAATKAVKEVVEKAVVRSRLGSRKPCGHLVDVSFGEYKVKVSGMACHS